MLIFFFRTIIQRNGKNCQYKLISKERKQKRNGKYANGKHMEGNEIRNKNKDTIPNEIECFALFSISFHSFCFFSFLFDFFSFLFAFFSLLFAFFSFLLTVKNVALTTQIIITKNKNTQRK